MSAYSKQERAREDEEEGQHPAKRVKQERAEISRSSTVKREIVGEEEEEVVFLSTKVIRKTTVVATAPPPAVKDEAPTAEEEEASAMSEQASRETITGSTSPEVKQPRIKQEDGGNDPRLTELLRETANFIPKLIYVEKDLANARDENAPQAPGRPQMPADPIDPWDSPMPAPKVFQMPVDYQVDPWVYPWDDPVADAGRHNTPPAVRRALTPSFYQPKVKERRAYLRDVEEVSFSPNNYHRKHSIVFKLGGLLYKEVVGSVRQHTKLANVYDYLCREWNGGRRPAYFTFYNDSRCFTFPQSGELLLKRGKELHVPTFADVSTLPV